MTILHYLNIFIILISKKNIHFRLKCFDLVSFIYIYIIAYIYVIYVVENFMAALVALHQQVQCSSIFGCLVAVDRFNDQ